MRIRPVLIGTLTATLAHAQPGPPPGYRPGPDAESVSYAYADVLRADPVYETYVVSEPREECRDVAVERRGSRYENTNTGTIVGALVGAALGNQVGKGDGRDAATVAGAVIGGAVGREIDASDNVARTHRGVERQCRVVERRVEERRIVGYDVEYRYRGEVYFSRLRHDPGERLRIRVAVSPADP